MCDACKRLLLTPTETDQPWKSIGCRWQNKSQQHLVFPGGLPSKYYPGPTLLNFVDLTRTSAFNVVWPMTSTLKVKLGLKVVYSIAWDVISNVESEQKR